MNFAYPYLLLGFPIVLLIRFLLYKKFGKKETEAIKLHFFKISESRSSLMAYLPKVLQLLGIFLLFVALARPQDKLSKIKRSVYGIDIILVLDLSQSMLIEDFQPNNRLYVAKKVVQDFVDKRQNDRIGLVLFSGDAYAAVPLTLDTALIKKRIEDVVMTDFKEGTAIGVALATAVSRFDPKSDRQRVIILLTDGDNNTGSIDPYTAAQVAKESQAKIYAVAIGKDGRAPMPSISQDLFGRPMETRAFVTSKIDFSAFERIAQISNGQAFRAQSPDVLIDVFEKIDQIEKSKIEASEYIKYEEKYLPYLIAGTILLFAGLFLGQTYFRILRISNDVRKAQ